MGGDDGGDGRTTLSGGVEANVLAFPWRNDVVGDVTSSGGGGARDDGGGGGARSDGSGNGGGRGRCRSSRQQ